MRHSQGGARRAPGERQENDMRTIRTGMRPRVAALPVIALPVIVLAALGAGLAAPAAAEDPAGAGRYTIAPSADGFVRLDTVTGAVSYCRQAEGAWTCETATEQSGMDAALGNLAARAARLSEDVDALERDIAALRGGGAAPPAAQPQSGEPALTPEDERELDRMSVFSERLFRNFFTIVSEMKDELRD
jgi:hypothetical protein